MWRAFDETGRLAVPRLHRDRRCGSCRCTGCARSAARSTSSGMVLFGYNILTTWKARPATYEEPVIQAAPLADASTTSRAAPTPAGALGPVRPARPGTGAGRRLPLTFTVMVGGGGDRGLALRDHPDLPHPLERADHRVGQAVHAARAGGARPLHPRGLLQLPLADDPPASATRPSATASTPSPASSCTTIPFLWGSRRIGPDLAREGGKYPDLWHVRHMRQTRGPSTAKSIMPAYPWLLTNTLDFAGIQNRVDVMAMLGVPYGDAVSTAPRDGAGAGRDDRAAHRRPQGGPAGPGGQGDRRAGRLPAAPRHATSSGARRRACADREGAEMRLSDDHEPRRPLRLRRDRAGALPRSPSSLIARGRVRPVAQAGVRARPAGMPLDDVHPAVPAPEPRRRVMTARARRRPPARPRLRRHPGVRQPDAALVAATSSGPRSSSRCSTGSTCPGIGVGQGPDRRLRARRWPRAAEVRRAERRRPGRRRPSCSADRARTRRRWPRARRSSPRTASPATARTAAASSART